MTDTNQTTRERVYVRAGIAYGIGYPQLSDEEMAGAVRMLMRQDLNHEAVCVAARDRILCLIGERDEARADARAARQEQWEVLDGIWRRRAETAEAELRQLKAVLPVAAEMAKIARLIHDKCESPEDAVTILDQVALRDVLASWDDLPHGDTAGCARYSPDPAAGGTDCKHCGMPYDQHLATKDAERRWCDDVENACPCCGGSGHKDDADSARKSALAQTRRYFALSSASGMHIGLWDDERYAVSAQSEYPGSTIQELVGDESAARFVAESIAQAIRARTDADADADALAALEQVKRDAFHEALREVDQKVSKLRLQNVDISAQWNEAIDTALDAITGLLDKEPGQ